MKLIQFLSDHRYYFGMNPKGWTDEDEKEYQAWARKHGDPRAIYKDVELMQ